MKKILVIGSAVVDVIIHLEDHLPVTGEDVHVVSQQMRLGGCAYNTSDILRHFGIPYIPFFPVGSGAYGDFVFSEFEKRSICSPIPRPEEWNGRTVPEVLLSGNHKKIAEWRTERSIDRTMQYRPELMEQAVLDKKAGKYYKDCLKNNEE